MKARTPVGVLALGLSSAVLIGYSAAPASADTHQTARHTTTIGTATQLADIQWQLATGRDDPPPSDLVGLLAQVAPLVESVAPLLARVPVDPDKVITLVTPLVTDNPKLTELAPTVLELAGKIDFAALAQKTPQFSAEEANRLFDMLAAKLMPALEKLKSLDPSTFDLSKLNVAQAADSIKMLIDKLPNLANVPAEKVINIATMVFTKILGLGLDLSKLPSLAGLDIGQLQKSFDTLVRKLPNLAAVDGNRVVAVVEKLVSAAPRVSTGDLCGIDLSKLELPKILGLFDTLIAKAPSLAKVDGDKLLTAIEKLVTAVPNWSGTDVCSHVPANLDVAKAQELATKLVAGLKDYSTTDVGPLVDKVSKGGVDALKNDPEVKILIRQLEPLLSLAGLKVS